MPGSTDWTSVVSDWAQWLFGIIIVGAGAAWAAIGNKDRKVEAQLDEYKRGANEEHSSLGKRIAQVEIRLERLAPAQCVVHGERLTRVEEHIQRVPTHDDLNRAHARIDEVSKGIARIEGSVARMEPMLNTLTSHLLDRGS